MEKKNYFNFMAFRKGLYDGNLSERARLVYIHLLQKSSNKGCADNALYNDIELTKELIAIDLGILTKTGEPSIKLIQRALEELEENGYIKRFQKYKSKGCPLTIRLNLKYDFLNQNCTQIDNEEESFLPRLSSLENQKTEKLEKNDNKIEESENKNDSSFDKNESGFVHHYNPSLSSSNLLLSNNNYNIIEKNKKIEVKKTFIQETEQSKSSTVEDEDCDRINWSKELIQFEHKIKKASSLDEIKLLSRKFSSLQDQQEIPTELEEMVQKVQNTAIQKSLSLKCVSTHAEASTALPF